MKINMKKRVVSLLLSFILAFSALPFTVFSSNFNSGVHYAKNGNMQSAYEYIGRCLHYLQDACEPHHASNIISLGYTSHSVFES